MKFIFGTNIKKTLVRVFLIVLFSYVFFGIVMLFFQRDLIYYPTDKDFWTCNVSDTSAKKVEINGERGLLSKGTTDRIIIFYHGNQDSACNWRYIPNHFGFAGDTTLVLEYPGYAGDDREITKENLFAHVDQVHAWLETQEYKEVYLVSYSIGGALASYHASLGADKLLMFAPFDSLINVIWDKHLYYPEWMLYDDYNNTELLLQSDLDQLLIMHGGKDTVIDQKRSVRLAQQLNRKIKVDRIVVPDAGHQNLLQGNPFNKIIDQFLLQ